MDFADSTSCQKLAEIHQKNGLVPDIIYTSNIRNFIEANRLFQHEISLEKLAGPDTIFVDTEEQSFKIGTRLSLAYAQFSLQTYINYQSFYGQPQHRSIQRFRLREKRAIRELYPIMNLPLEPIKTFFLRYGIREGYFTEVELREADRLIDEKIESTRSIADQLFSDDYDLSQNPSENTLATHTVTTLFGCHLKTVYDPPKLFCSDFFLAP